MTVTLSVMYPNIEGSKFDMDYYLGTHLEMVSARLSDKGLVSARVVKGLGTPDPETPAPYQVIALVEFESAEKLTAAMAIHGEEIMGDIPNFTDVTPVVQISENIT